jgi:O-antigen/teichoic acid export membrane protein
LSLAWSPFKRIKNKFLRDTATLQATGLINQASQILSTVLIARILGAEGQGLFVSAIALQGLFYFLLNMGLTQATISQLAAAHARNNRVKVAGWLAFMAKCLILFGIVLAATGWFILPAVGELIFDFFEDGAGGHGHQIGIWAWLLCLQPILEMPRIVAGVAFQGTRRMFALGTMENGQEVTRLFLVILGAAITDSPQGAIIGYLGACLVGSVLAIDMYTRVREDDPGLLPSVREIWTGMRGIPIMRGLRLGIRVGLLKNGHSLFITVFPRLIIGGVAGMGWVAYFHIAQRIMQVPMMFTMGVTRTVLPAMSELAGLRDMKALRRLFMKAALITGSVVGGGIVIAIPIITPLVDRLFPEDYADKVYVYYCILALGYVPAAFASCIESFYITTNLVRWWIGLTIVGAIITIPTNVWLVLNVPYTGTAWGHSLYQSWVIIHCIFILIWFTRNDESHWDQESDPPKVAA